ncbi:hypothetical protein [Moraxella oblonga]|uniref:hypothetical protein n=1 Tax=Moraxella oblonga TaxID=200413 RepID=UPI0012EE2800|nr:hypothetical protein [Moraxella oblonga]
MQRSDEYLALWHLLGNPSGVGKCVYCDDRYKDNTPLKSGGFDMAVKEGFEPSIRY